MSGANHVVGGIVFTGLYLSMFDVNIYSKPQYLGLAIFFSLLPDIDHTKSIVGKMFYPVAKFLDRRFGHRTITHSLLCYFGLALVIGIVERTWLNTTIATSIFLWAYASHLILDMLTVQGVPLLYPFKKNPCVIPGNPKYRFRSSDFKTESIAFVLFVMLAFSTKDLFAHGFWNSYDRLFGTVKSVHAESRLTGKALLVRYQITQDGRDIAGNGFLISSTPERLLLFNQGTGFREIRSTDHVKQLLPIRTNANRAVLSVSFQNIGMDSLRAMLRNRAVMALKLQSALPIQFTKDNQPQSSTSISLENVFNPVFATADIDSIDGAAEREISLVRLEIEAENAKQAMYWQEKAAAESRYKSVLADLNSDDLAVREKAVREQDAAAAALKSVPKPLDNRQALRVRLNYLQSKLHVKKSQSINGYMQYIQIQ